MSSRPCRILLSVSLFPGAYGEICVDLVGILDFDARERPPVMVRLALNRAGFWTSVRPKRDEVQMAEKRDGPIREHPLSPFGDARP